MKTVKVFTNGRSRAVRIPKDWLAGADEVYLKRDGSSVIIEPVRPNMREIAERFREKPIWIDRKPQSKTPPKTLSL